MKKHRTQKLLSLFLALLMLVLSMPFAAAEDSDIVLHTAAGEDGYWELNNEGRLTIAGAGEMPYPQDSAIDLWRDVIDQIRILDIRAGITSIPEDSFYRCSTIEQVLLPDTLISIGNYAFFMLTDMEHLTIPESVKTIGRFAFDGCVSLKELVIPEGVQTIEEHAFELCLSLESIYNYSPTAVTTNCGTFRLKETDFWTREKIIDVARWLAETGYMAMAPFNDTQESQITAEMMQSFNTRFGTDFTAGEYLSLIQDVANTSAADNPTVYCYSDSAEKQSCIEKGYNYRTIGETLSGQCGENAFWSYDTETATLTVSGTGATWEIVSNDENIYQAETVVVEEGITEIGSFTFCNFGQVSSIIFPETLISIGGRVLDSTSISEIYIPKNVAEISTEAFAFCMNIKKYIVNSENETYSSREDGCLFNKNKTKLVLYAIGRFGDYAVPDSVETIGYAAFQNTNYLDHVTLGSSVKRIEPYAFFQSSLESITIPNGVERIEHEAFWRCGLSQVTLPASVEYLGYECFHECGLESITILNPNCVIECTPVGTESEGEDCGDKTIPSPIICGYLDSSAQRFAETYNRVLIDVTKETVFDADTGVAVTYDADAFDPDVHISITELPTGNENSRSWDITPMLNGTKVQPKKPVQVRLPIPAEWDKSGIVVAHVDENGNKTYPAFTIEGDYVVFWASAFSEYLLEQKTPHTHDYTDHETISKPATCTEAGEKQCFCACGESKIVGIDPLGHNIVHHDAKTPTCTESGYDAYDSCSRCDYTTCVEQAALGHIDENNDGKCDTCGEKMTGGKHCPQCGKIHNKGFLDKLTGFFHKIAYRLTHLFKR